MSAQPLFEIVPAGNESHAVGAIEAAVIDTLASLQEAGMLVGKYRAIGETLKHSARAVDRGLQAQKLTVATTQMTKQLFETLDKLPEPKLERGGAFDSLAEVIESLTKAALA